MQCADTSKDIREVRHESMFPDSLLACSCPDLSKVMDRNQSQDRGQFPEQSRRNSAEGNEAVDPKPGNDPGPSEIGRLVKSNQILLKASQVCSQETQGIGVRGSGVSEATSNPPSNNNQ